MRWTLPCLLLVTALAGTGCETISQFPAEDGILENHVQLTFPDRFVKAGECYFSPDDSMVVFQATEVPPEGQAPDPFYAMFVADVARSGSGRVTGLENIRKISPDGSANTCGWFDPSEPDVVIFGSTVVPPKAPNTPGYQRGTSRYIWEFPTEMRIVAVRLDGAAADMAEVPQVICGDMEHYQAECSLTCDGEHLLYSTKETGEGDIYVRRGGRRVKLVGEAGYDGGPFFSPDDKRICYRSDRNLDDHLQLYVADLAFDGSGTIVGIEREHQLTDDPDVVNWCPYWHPDGEHLVYSTSELGHMNYEVFIIDAAPGRYGENKRRVTHFEVGPGGKPGSDVLPAFSHDGRTMVWTSRRGPMGTPQLWAAEFVMEVD